MKEVSPLVVSGSIAIDRIMSFRGSYQDHLHPDRLHNLSISTFLDELVDSRGGSGANIAYSSALLGDHPVLLTSIGPNGDEYVKALEDVGVDMSHIHRSKLATASFNVITDADQNQIGGFYSGAMFDSNSLSFEPWKDADAIFTISPQDPKAMERLVEECRKWKLRVFYDISQQVTNVDGAPMKRGIEVAEVLILNDYEINLMAKKTGQTVQDIKAKVPIVVTTQGKTGSVIEGKNVPEPIKIGIAKANQMADPTGAGDAYRAGFLHGYARGWPLKTCGQLAAVIASFAIEHVGTQIHRFTYKDVEARYQQAFSEELELK